MKLLLTFLLSTVACINANAIPINVAEGAAVTLNGTYGVLRTNPNFPSGPLASGASLTDGILLPTATAWNNGTVWWDAQAENDVSASNWIHIALGAKFNIFGFSFQGDDNDVLQLDYWDGGAWIPAWTIPKAPTGIGMQTRPNTADPDEIFVLGSAIMTDELRLAPAASVGDDYFGIGEIRAYSQDGSAGIPEPATFALFSLGLASLGWSRRKKA